MEQIEKEKIQSNKGSSYKLLVEQAKLKQATSKVSSEQLYIQYAAPHSQLRNVFLNKSWIASMFCVFQDIAIQNILNYEDVHGNFILIDSCFVLVGIILMIN